MSDEAQTIRGIQWREAFPFTHLFRAFRVAVHPSKLILGLVALIALYMGGRVLDGIWSARSLAVPGEIAMYESVVTTGGMSDQFAAERLKKREEVEAAYAKNLLARQIVTDEKVARDAAEEGDKLRDVKAKILEARKKARDQVEMDFRAARDAANKLTDKQLKDRMLRAADEALRYGVRNAYFDASNEWKAAESIKGEGIFHAFFTYESKRINDVIEGVKSWNWLGSAKDDRGPGVIDSVISFFRIAPVWMMRHHPIYFVLFTLWFLTIWAIFGGAIARIAAIHVAREEKLSVRAALAFSSGKFLSFVSAPLIPLVIVLIVGLVPLVAGLLASIPVIGPVVNIVMSALFVLILAAGFVMTLVLLGTFGGFNLMYPTIAVEGSDSFDAISRSFSYVYARPWRMLFYTVIAIVYGALCYVFVKFFIWMMLSLTHHFVGAGYFSDAQNLAPLWSTMWPGPQRTGTLSFTVDWLSLRWDQSFAAFLLSFWIYLVVGMLGAFVISFYFSANTIIYYLMRHEVDATELDDVYVEQADEDFTDTTTPIPTASAAAVGAVVVDTSAASPSSPSSTPPASDNPPPSGTT